MRLWRRCILDIIAAAARMDDGDGPCWRNCALVVFKEDNGMTIDIDISKKDIQKIVAEKFGVDPEDVYIDCFMKDVGYGMNERKEPSVCVTVRKHANEEGA